MSKSRHGKKKYSVQSIPKDYRPTVEFTVNLKKDLNLKKIFSGCIGSLPN